MRKLFSVQWHSNLRKPSPSLPRPEATGFSMVEPMVALVMVAVVVAGTAQMSLSSGLLSVKARTYDSLEAATSADLGWLKWYANTWRCFTGRYASCTTKASYLSYNPSTADCANIAQAFLSAASTASTTPARPYAVPANTGSAQAISLSNAPGTSLSRIISVSSSGNRINVRYQSSGSVSYTKDASVLIDASAWCTP